SLTCAPSPRGLGLNCHSRMGRRPVPRDPPASQNPGRMRASECPRPPDRPTCGSGYVRPMTRHVELRELLVGIEGLALLRHLYDSSNEEALQRLSEVRRFLDDEAFAASEETSEADPRAGYRCWPESYDEPGNPIIQLEEPVVWSLLDGLAPGRALDAACGTGRHARHLAELGHDVVGIDLTPEMLARARAAVPAARFFEGDVLRLPADDGTFDIVVCGLALAHVADLDAAVAELGRVLAEGGRLVVSVLHPFQAFLGWHAPFEGEDGRRRFIRE